MKIMLTFLYLLQVIKPMPVHSHRFNEAFFDTESMVFKIFGNFSTFLLAVQLPASVSEPILETLSSILSLSE